MSAIDVLPYRGVELSVKSGKRYRLMTPRGGVSIWQEDGFKVMRMKDVLHETETLKDAVYWVLLKYGKGPWDLADLKRRFEQVEVGDD